MRWLIVNADDFGLVEEINRAVVAAYRLGTVTSATLMVNGEAVEDAASQAAQHPGLGVGLHFTLTFGVPLDPGTGSLVDRDGRFLSRGGLLRRALSGRLRSSDIERELRAQLRRMKALGIRPTHLDGHQHVQVLPAISAVIADVASEWRLPTRVPLVAWRREAGASRLPQRAMLAALCRWSRIAGLRPATASFVSVFDTTEGRATTAKTYARIVLGASGTAVELMVHPSFPSARLAAIHPDIYDVALAEAAALTAPALPPLLAGTGRTLATFAEMTR